MPRRKTIRRRTPKSSSRVTAWIARTLSAWGRFAFATDNLAGLNWALLAATVVVAVMGWVPTQVWLIALAVGVIVTGTRAMWLGPARQKVVESAYQQTQRLAGHPAGTTQRPAPVEQRIMVRKWRGSRPTVVKTLVSPESPALTHPDGLFKFEQALADILPTPSGWGWVHEWEAGTVLSSSVPGNDVRLAQAAEQQWVFRTLVQAFPPKRGTGAPMRLAVTEWRDDTEKPVIATGRLALDTYDVSDPLLRRKVEDGMDAGVKRPDIVWLYDWDSSPGFLLFSSVTSKDPMAVRKDRHRKIIDLVTHHTKPPRGAAPPQVAITRWVDDPEHPGFNQPFEISVDFGTMDIASVEWRQGFMNALDTALEAEMPDRVWLYDWTHATTSTVVMGAVPPTHQWALRKHATHRVQQIVAEKFPTKRNGRPTDVDVLEWRSEKDDRGTIVAEHPDRMVVNFGTADVSDPDTRLAFQVHLDSTTTANDWHYSWEANRGLVEVTSVPALPEHIAFPKPGTDEFDHWIDQARKGRITIGPKQGGGYLTVDFNKIPHAMTGGNTGAGKSVQLTLYLFAALYLPDEYELIVCDPKRTDFTWTPEFPNVRFAATSEEIAGAVQYAYEEMNRRQDLNSAHQVRNIDGLPEDVRPRRLLLFFDEMGAYFSPSKDKDTEALRQAALSQMEQIAMLGRAMHVNIVGAAQKPTAKDVGTKLRSQLGAKTAVGWLDSDTSTQVLGNTLANALDKDKAPRGRGVSSLEGEEPSIYQGYFLPDRTCPLPWDPSGEPWPGTIDIIHARLIDLGYQRVMVPSEVADGAGGSRTVEAPKWVRPPSQEEIAAQGVDDTSAPEVDESPFVDDSAPAPAPSEKRDKPSCAAKECSLEPLASCGECDRAMCLAHLHEHPMAGVAGHLCDKHYQAHHLVRSGGVDAYAALHQKSAEHDDLTMDAEITGDASWTGVLRTSDGKKVVQVVADSGDLTARSANGSETGAMVPVFVVHAVQQWSDGAPVASAGTSPSTSRRATRPAAPPRRPRPPAPRR